MSYINNFLSWVSSDASASTDFASADNKSETTTANSNEAKQESSFSNWAVDSFKEVADYVLPDAFTARDIGKQFVKNAATGTSVIGVAAVAAASVVYAPVATAAVVIGGLILTGCGSSWTDD